MRLQYWLILCATGCATASQSDEPRSSTDVVKATIAPQQTLDLTHQTVIHAGEYPATRDQVWTALLAAADDLGMPLQSADSASGIVIYVVRTTGARVAGRPASAWVDCGRGPAGAPRADTYQVTLRVSAAMAPTKSGTRVNATLVGFARERGMSGDGLPCTSTGELERRTLAAVAAKLPS
jgi:hypothetical protein